MGILDDLDEASTSYLERQNATMRHKNGRIRRLCYAFSKKLENHCAAVALTYTHYNFCCVLRDAKITPAVGIGLAREPWDIGTFMEALMKAEPCEPPTAQPLAIPRPETPARELPGGRGYLRALPGGKTSPAPSPEPAPIAPAPIAVTPSHVPSPSPRRTLRPVPRKPEQLDLFNPPKKDPPDSDRVS